MTKSSFFVLCLFFLFSCQDNVLDPSVTKSVNNNHYKLSLTLSDDIVREDGNIKIDAALERLVNSPYLKPSKVLGEWYLREINDVELEEDSINIVYEFLADSTFELSTTFSFSNMSLGSQVLGSWTVYSDSKYELDHGFDTTTTADVNIGNWTYGDSSYVVNTRDIIHVDSIRAFEYSFSNDYGFELDDKIVYQRMTVTEIDTNISWDDTTGSSFEYISTTRDTAFSTDSTMTEREGLWEYVEDSVKTLTLRYYDVPGGELEVFTTIFDLDIATIPTNGYMYWSDSDSRTVILQKTSASNNFSSPDDSTAAFHGGWLFSETEDAFTVTTILNNETENATVTFDAPGSTVPEGGYMFWATENGDMYTFEKKDDASSYDPNFENIDMGMIVSALGGDIYVLNSTTGSDYKSFDVDIGHGAGDEFKATSFFEPSSSAGSNGYISAEFNDLTLTISVYIISE